MTEQTQANVNAPAGNSEPDKKDVATIPGLAPEFVKIMQDELRKQIVQHNDLAETIKNTGDRVALKDQYFANPESTNDATAVETINRIKVLEEELENAHRRAMELLEPHIADALKKSGVEQKQAEADEIAKRVKATLNYFGAFNVPVTDMPTLAGRPNRNVTSAGNAGTGAGTPKYRNLEVYVGDTADTLTLAAQDIVVTKDGVKSTRKASNLTYGAKAANVTNDVFRKAFTDAAGTTDAAQFPERTEFTVKDLTGKVHYCVVKKVPADVA